jgi:hypothetical protein
MKDPFVCGINMNELKQVISRSSNTCVVTILDCCYSGIATKGDKSISDTNIKYEDHVKDFSSGEGRIILASSGEDQTSREIIFKHEDEKEPHPHGVFTFYLIEGLNGKAADKFGKVYLNRLNEYVETQLRAMKKQQTKFFAAGASGMSTLEIAKSPKIEKIRVKLDEAKIFCKEDDPALRIRAIENIYAVLKDYPENGKALDYKDKINIALTKYQDKVNCWLFENELIVKPKILNVFRELDTLAGFLDFDKIVTLDNRKKTLLANLCKVSLEMIDNEGFIKKCKQYDNPPPSILKKDKDISALEITAKTSQVSKSPSTTPDNF